MYYFILVVFILWIAVNGVVASIVGVLILIALSIYRLCYNPSRSVDESSLYQWPSSGNFAVQVVGESKFQESLGKLSQHGVYHTALLFLDDGNPEDYKAVAIYLNKRRVGYLSRKEARAFRRRLANNKFTGKHTLCNAKLAGGHKQKDGLTARYSVTLDIDPFD